MSSVQNQALGYLTETYKESLRIKERFLEEYAPKLIEMSERIGQCFHQGGKLMLMGNGGSAADAQHWAAEMVGRMLIERRPLPVLALTTDTSIITAVANDYSYDEIFEKQVQALGKPGDVLFAISTSGKSPNILKATRRAKEMGLTVFGLTGRDGGPLMVEADLCLCATEGKNSSRIQETHIFAIHSIVDILDRFYLK